MPKFALRYSDVRLQLEQLRQRLEEEDEEEDENEAPAGLSTVANTPKVGDILYSSWGYDQTNIDFYKVLAVTKASVKIAQIPSKLVGGSGGTSELVVPDTSAHPTGKTLTKRFRPAGGGLGYGVRVSSYAGAYLWNGKPKSQTGAGYGH